MNESWKNYIFNYTNPYDYMKNLRKGFSPTIICVSINGGVQGKEYNPNIPETPDEIAHAAFEAYKAGASMVHIHARDPNHITEGAKKREHWLEVNRKVREECPDIIINNTTGGGLTSTMEERLSCLDAGCEIASLNTIPDMSKFHMKAREAPLDDPRPPLNYNDCVPYTYELVYKFAAEMKKRNIKPEVELYNSGSSYVVHDLIRAGLLEKPYWLQTVMGYQTGSFPTVPNVLEFLRDMPDDSIWLCSGIGINQLPMNTLAALMGGHIRVGLEDNIYFSKGKLADSNAQLVTRIVNIVRSLNRKVANPSEARSILGLSQTPRPIPDD